jgi:hypothetical protein
MPKRDFLRLPVVSAGAEYLVMDGFQALCQATGVAPCVLDAAIFASFDDGGWTEENIVW